MYIEDDNITLDMLMEDLSDISREYLFDVILEDVSVQSPEERKTNKENILKRFWNAFIMVLKYIGKRLREFYTKVSKYLATLKNEECIVKEDCEVSHEIITGIGDKPYKTLLYIAKGIGMASSEGDDNLLNELESNINKWFESEKKKLTKGTIMKLNILKRNLLKVCNDHDKVTNEIEKLENKITTTNVSNTYFSKTQETLKKYQAYLVRIMNEISDFIKNKVSIIIDRKYKEVNV